MRHTFWQSIPLAACLLVGTPALAHVGHGDEFQATGNLERVEVNTETDGQLGIEVTPIEESVANGDVLVPATALVTEDEQSFAFVKYENFYEPVAVITGASQGDLITVTEGLSAGEQLVTQGGLSLYAQSRRTHEADHDDHYHGPSLKKSAAMVTLVVLAMGGAFVVTSRNKRQDETPVA